MRIVSLLPSATDIACELGLGDALVGVSHSCDAPAVAKLPRVTRSRIPSEAPSRVIDAAVRDALVRRESLYEVNADLLRRLAPDLVLTQDLCDVCAVGEAEVAAAVHAAGVRPTVLTLGPRTLAGVWECIRSVGGAAGRSAVAAELIEALEARVVRIRRLTEGATRPGVVFLEWLDPPIVGGHWNPELVELAGGQDVLGTPGMPSRTTTWEEIASKEPDVLCVACCGLTAARAGADLEALAQRLRRPGLRQLQESRIAVFDGVGLFSRPGPRLADSLELLAATLHPALIRDEATGEERRHPTLRAELPRG